ncbi:MAG: hypothetical protein WCF90_06120, partial [Methanomicrobiales archaeon]
QGMIGIIFGLFTLMVLNITLEIFYVRCWVLLVVGIAGFLLFTITSKSDDSMFWLTLPAILIAIGVASFFAHDTFANIFVLLIAGVAVYSSFSDITLTHPKTKFILIQGMFIMGEGTPGSVDLLRPRGLEIFSPEGTGNICPGLRSCFDPAGLVCVVRDCLTHGRHPTETYPEKNKRMKINSHLRLFPFFR